MIKLQTLLQRLGQLSTTHVADALDACNIEGVLLATKPVFAGAKLLGPAYTVQYAPYKENPSHFNNAANYIDNVPAGAVLVIDNQGREDCTTWGEILTHTALYKGIKGTVVNGAIRDVEAICSLRYPVFSKAIAIRSGKNRVYKIKEERPLIINQVTIKPGDIIFGDGNGVLAIPLSLLKEIILKAENIKYREKCIVKAVNSGISLEKARQEYRYDQPWLQPESKTENT